jgi:Fe-S oxidoreductase
MLPFGQRLLFLAFAAISGGFGVWGFYRLYRRIARGRPDTDARTNGLMRRMGYALVTTLTQSRTFRKRPVVSFFHSFIFYGFTFYLLVNLVDAVEGFVRLPLASLGLLGHLYVFGADVLSALVLLGVVALFARRFLLPSRRTFNFNERTVLHPDVRARYIAADSLIVSTFILFHVGSRAIGSGARLALEGPDRFSPFATALSHLFNPQNALGWEIFGYWGALGSVLAFLAYFPYTKHVHIFMAPVKYLVAREVSSGVLPSVVLDLEAEEPSLGAARLEDLAWPRLIDAYACIQCNRCQDVCPATATGKALSPSALEINKRMELNGLGKHFPAFEKGAASPKNLLTFALSPEAAWACTTCGACLDVCPVQDEPMLDIIDIRRQQVMIEGEFPAQLQTAFRGMERAQNPWGINHEKRMDWAEGLNVRTTDENPEPDVLFWVGCAASYDPQSQKTARAFVQLLAHAEVDFAVLGKRECCTGDTARRAGNEYLYRQLADKNVETLNEIKPKLIVATCPHCMNSIGKEYKQLGGDYKVMHHTEYLDTLVASGRLDATPGPSTVTYHDPCYLGRHNGVYDAPRNVLNILSNSVVELPRNRENAFCCGAGGAQFWKEEEAGEERISDNRFHEVQEHLKGSEDKVLAVGCPFCKSMLESTPSRASDPIAIKDVAELLLEGLQRKHPSAAIFHNHGVPADRSELTISSAPMSEALVTDSAVVTDFAPLPVIAVKVEDAPEQPTSATAPAPGLTPSTRKVWAPRRTTEVPVSIPENQMDETVPAITAAASPTLSEPVASTEPAPAPARKAWTPKRNRELDSFAIAETPNLIATDAELSKEADAPPTDTATAPPPPVARKTWTPKKKADVSE